MDCRTSLVFRLRSLNNQIKRLMERSAIARNDANLTGMQYAMLSFLAARHGDTDTYQRDVEAEFNIRRSTATGMLQGLEKAGYIRREAVPGDARLKRIAMTKAAFELNEVASEHMLQVNEKLICGLTPGELEQFYLVLDKIAKNAEE